MKTRIIVILMALSLSLAAAAQRVLMVGDSHIALKTYPEELKSILHDECPEVDFDCIGVGGAGFYTYVNKPSLMQKIYDKKPEVLVVALGTNDCNNTQYMASRSLKFITRFYDGIKANLPDCKIVFVTPFYFKTKKVHGSGMEINPNVPAMTKVICDFAASHDDTYSINLLDDYGMYFLDNNLLRKDLIHLTKYGYISLANLVADGLLSLPVLNCAPLPLAP